MYKNQRERTGLIDIYSSCFDKNNVNIDYYLAIIMMQLNRAIFTIIADNLLFRWE